jgi:recombination protein RecA
VLVRQKLTEGADVTANSMKPLAAAAAAKLAAAAAAAVEEATPLAVD